MDILSLFACYQPLVLPSAVRHFAKIVQALLTLTGRTTMLGIWRWSEPGGSYRTIQRFFATAMPWTHLLVKFFETHLFDFEGEYILAGNATTVTKAGCATFGIDRFFSGLVGKVVKGLEFIVFSWVAMADRKAYPLAVKQMVRTEAEKKVLKERKKKRVKKSKKRRSGAKGRRTGSRNRDKSRLELSPELLRINALLTVLLKLIRGFVKVGYLARGRTFRT